MKACLAGACAIALVLGLAGCASSSSATAVTDTENSSSSNSTPAQQLAANSNTLNDHADNYTADVSNSMSIPYTFEVETSTDANEKTGTTTSESSSADATSNTTTNVVTVDVPVDPYARLWDATGVITDINHSNHTCSVRLLTCDSGHFNAQDVLLDYGNRLSFSELKLDKNVTISFQYLLTRPMSSPLQVYNVEIF